MCGGRGASGALLGAAAPALWAARAVGLLTYRQDAHGRFVPCKVSAVYAALICGYVTAVVVYLIADHNWQLNVWSSGQQVDDLWWTQKAAPDWLPLLQFKVNFHFASVALVVPLAQLVALRAQPRLAALLRAADALANRVPARVARAVCATLFRRLRAQLIGSLCFVVTLHVTYAVFIILPTYPLFCVALIFSTVDVMMVMIVVYVQFNSFAFFIKEIFRHTNNRLDSWSKGESMDDEEEFASERWRAAPSARGVRAVARLLGRACDAAERLGRAFSVMLLLVVLNLYANISCTLYYLALSLVFGYNDPGTPILGDTIMFCYLLFYAGALVLIVASCESLVREAKKTSYLVHNLMINCEDSLLKQELQLLSLQLLHRPIKFSACGFFVLDFSLLYSVVGAVTTYLVILIQIQLSFGSKN